MSAQQGQKPFRSIQARVIIPLVGMISIAALIMAGLTVLVTRKQGQSAEENGTNALRAQAESYIVGLNQAMAQENNLILDRVRQDAEKLAVYTASLYDHPEAFNSQAYWSSDSSLTRGAAGQYFNGKDNPTSVFVPNNQDFNDQVQRDLEISAYLDFTFKAVYQNDTYVEAIYFGSPNNIIRYYPNVGLGEALPPDFRVTERVWYTGSILENDPQKGSWWTPVYTDVTGLVTTAAAPVYNEKQEFVGVVGLNINLREYAAQIESEHILGSGYSFLIDGSGRAIALPEQGYTDLLNRSRNQGETGTDLSSNPGIFAPVLKEMAAGNTGFQALQVNGNELLVAYTPIETTGWSYASVVNSNDVYQAVGGLRADLNQSTGKLLLTRVLPVTGLVLLLAGLLGWLIAHRIANPVEQIARAVHQMNAGHWKVDLPVSEKGEIGVLARETQNLAGQVQNTIAELEERLAEQKKELERRTAELQVAADVARDTTASRDQDTMLANALNLIRDRFGFYHAGIYMIDEVREFAVLLAASGEGGQEMLRRNHQLKIGESGMVGIVAGTSQARISPDVEADPDYFHNPFLPETRSEMALPLKAAGQMIGVLDVHSTEPAAFDTEDIRIMQTLADQLAVAIQNTSTFTEMAESLKGLNDSSSEDTKASWRKIIQQRGVKTGYAYRGLGLQPITEHPEEAATAIHTGKTTLVNGVSGRTEQAQPILAVPLRVRDQVIGAIDLKFDDDTLPPEAITTFEQIAERLSLALESSRLLEETQLRTEQLNLLQEITAAAASHLEMDKLIQEVVEMVRAGFEFSRCSVVFFDARQKSAVFVAKAVEYYLYQDEESDRQPIPILDNSLFHKMILAQQTTVFYDFSHDPGKETLAPFVHCEGLATLLLCPLKARGEVIGAILMETADPKRLFNAEDLQLLDQIGLQVSVAIDVVRMFEQIQLRAEREKTIAEINSRVRASTNVDVILQTSITELARILHVKKGSIQLQDSKGRAE